MLASLVVLAGGALLSGLVGSTIAKGLGAEYHLHIGGTAAVAIVAAFSGFGLAFAMYKSNGTLPLVGLLTKADRLSAVDKTFEVGYRGGVLGLARAFAWFDRYIIDGLMNFVGLKSIELGEDVRRLQTGRIGDYAVALVIGVMLLIALGGLR